MNVPGIPIEKLKEAPWNPNHMDAAMLARLTESISRYGLIVPLVVRPADDGYEVLSGNQRLAVITALGHQVVPCVVVDAGDADAMLMTQALNAIHGEDDLAAKAEVVRTILRFMPESSVLSLLPESTESLATLSELGTGDIAEHLEGWQRAQAARLRHFTFQMVDHQRDTVERALDRAAVSMRGDESNPNPRGNALFEVCRAYLEEPQ